MLPAALFSPNINNREKNAGSPLFHSARATIAKQM